jgi:hypothetical protein
MLVEDFTKNMKLDSNQQFKHYTDRKNEYERKERKRKAEILRI